MIIRKIIIRRASVIRNTLISKPYDERYFHLLLQIYECRIIGLCFYRSTTSFNSEKNKILNKEGERKHVR